MIGENIVTELQFICPKWLKGCTAVLSAIVAYRISIFLLATALLFLQGFPFRMVAFLHRWDFALVPLLAITAAVLFSRWVERFMASTIPRTRYIVLVVLLLLSINPLRARVQSQAVMCSPLHIAIERDYSSEAIEMIIEAFPYLINGNSHLEGYDYCPLAQVAYAGRADLAELLIKRGADIERAVQRLQQCESEDGVLLVLGIAKNHNR